MLLKKYKDGGKAKGYDRGGEVLQKQSGRRKREWGTSPNKSPGTETLMKGREFRKGLEGAPDLEDDLWAKYQKKRISCFATIGRRAECPGCKR